MLGKYKTHRWNFDGRYEDKSVTGVTVDIQMSGDGVVNGNSGKVAVQLKSDSQGVLFNVDSNYSGIEKYAKFAASSTAIELDANIIEAVSLKAQVKYNVIYIYN